MRRSALLLVVLLLATVTFAQDGPRILGSDETCPITAWNYQDMEAWKQNRAWQCGGTTQSPINANTRTQDQSLPTVRVDYYTGALHPITLRNTGYEYKAIPMFDGSVTFRTQIARLVQFHFHVPNEHVVDRWGNDVKAELHLVHETPAKEAIVIAVPIKAGGAANPALTALLKLTPLAACQSAASVRPDQLVPMRSFLPADMEFGQINRYITYVGSLTTPPCSQGVRFILVAPIFATQTQIDGLQLIPNNARRPPQGNTNPVTFRLLP